MKKITGITLIELMVALLLSMLIISCLTTIYLATEKNDSVQSSLIYIQENSRMAMQILNSTLRTAGYIGCAKLKNDFPINSTTDFLITEQNKMTSYHDPDLKKESDGISLQRASPFHATLIKSMSDNKTLYVPAGSHFKIGDVLMISDCKSADIFKIKYVENSSVSMKIEAEAPLTTRYQELAEVSQFEKISYFIGKTSRVDENNFPIYALYSRDIHSEKTELIEGIDDMKILYVVFDQGMLTEQHALDVVDWSKVVAVSVMLTFSALHHVPLQKNEFIYVALRQ